MENHNNAPRSAACGASDAAVSALFSINTLLLFIFALLLF